MPTLTPRRLAASLILTLAAAGTVLGRPVDVNQALDTIRRAHRQRDIVQRVDVTVTSRGTGRTESLLVRTDPPGTLRLSVGPILIWTEHGFLNAVHREDGRAVFKHPIDDRGPLPIIREYFPPLPLPQLALAFGPDTAVLNPTPYTRNMAWSAAEPTPEHAIALAGAGERCTAELFATAEGVIGALVIRIDDGAAVMDIRCAPAAPADFPAVEPPVDRRFDISSPRDFIRRGGLVLVGDRLPELPVFPQHFPGPDPALGPPGAIVFFRQWTREVATAVRAVRLAAESIDGFQYTLVMVFNPIEGAVELQMNEGASEIDPDPLFYTDEPDQSVRRFLEASSTLVVIDADNTVASITNLASVLGRDASEQDIFELHAAPDEEAAARLLREIESAVKPE